MTGHCDDRPDQGRPGSDKERLAAAYTTYTSDEYRSRWSLDNPGNRELLDERERILTDLLLPCLPDRPVRLLDLGCGGLSLLPSISSSRRVGVDILFTRLEALDADARSSTLLVNADGSRLPLRDEEFDVVVLSTVMSSVKSDAVRMAIAAETTRVLGPGGVVLWYDFRYPNPWNSETWPVGRRQVARLFPQLTPTFRSLTLMPPVARRLGKYAATWYPRLARVPPARSHLAAVLRKAPR